MPPLTWQQVVAPNFEGAIASQRLAGDAINNAFSGLSTALGKYNDYQQGQAAGALLTNAAQYKDPAALAQARADGSILKGINPDFLTPDAWKALDAHHSSLVNDALTSANTGLVGANTNRVNTLLPGEVALNKANVGLVGANTGLANANTNRVNQLLPGEIARNQSEIGEIGARTSQVRQTTDQQGKTFDWQAQGQTLAADAIRYASQNGGSMADAVNYASSHGSGPGLDAALQLMQRQSGTLQDGSPGPIGSVGGANGASSALGAAVAASPQVTSAAAAGENPEQLAARIKSLAPTLSNEECVSLANAAAGSSLGVADWRKGTNAMQTRLPPGTPVATFLKRDGSPSDRYDGGEGVGIRGNNTTHAAVVDGYDAEGNLRVWEQYKGSGGPHLVTYKAGDPRGGEKDANNYHSINDTNGRPIGTNNPLAMADNINQTENDYFRSLGDSIKANAAAKKGLAQQLADGTAGSYDTSSEDSTTNLNDVAKALKGETSEVVGPDGTRRKITGEGIFANSSTALIGDKLKQIMTMAANRKGPDGVTAHPTVAQARDLLIRYGRQDWVAANALTGAAQPLSLDEDGINAELDRLKSNGPDGRFAQNQTNVSVSNRIANAIGAQKEASDAHTAWAKLIQSRQRGNTIDQAAIQRAQDRLIRAQQLLEATTPGLSGFAPILGRPTPPPSPDVVSNPAPRSPTQDRRFFDSGY
jgi:hypothetical protein